LIGVISSEIDKRGGLIVTETTKPRTSTLWPTYRIIVRDHPFVDGNKRTAYLVAEAFCNLNDWRLEADDMESIIIFRALAAGEIEEEGLAKWFGRHLKKTQ
jgi:death-on-curing protein